MLESECKGNVYQMSTYKFKDKETGQDVAIINLKYIYKEEKILLFVLVMTTEKPTYNIVRRFLIKLKMTYY